MGEAALAAAYAIPAASISALVAGKIEELVGEDAKYRAARRRALEWLSQGWHLGAIL